MTSIALRGIAHRPFRALLTAFAVVLGVALVSGALLLSGSIQRGFDAVFTSTYSQTDAVVRADRLIGSSSTGRAVVPGSALTRIRGVPQVDTAVGQLIDFSGDTDLVRVFTADGRRISTPGAPAFGFGLDASDPRLSPFTLKDGRWAHGSAEVVLDAGTAASHGIAVGDRVTVAGDAARYAMAVVGLARLGGLDSTGGALIALMDVPTAQAVHGKDGYDAILATARPGVADAALVAALRPVTPHGFAVRTGAEAAREDGRSMAPFIAFIRWFLVGLGGVSLLVGAFVIFNTFAITVAQRTRELGTMRALGATGRQVRRLVALEALIIGLLASAAGVVAGFGLVVGMAALLRAFDVDMPREGGAVTAGTILVPMAVGTAVTVIAGLVPAVRASRVSPMAAIRNAAAHARRSRRADVATVVVLGLAAALVGICVAPGGQGIGTRVLSLIAGLGFLFAGIGLAAPRVAAPLTRLLSAPVRRLGGVPGDLAQANARLNPGRTAATAVALAVGLVLVGFVAVFGNSLKTSVTDGVTRQIRTPYVVTGDETWHPVPAGVAEALSDAPGLTAVSAVRRDRGRAAGDDLDVTGVDTATIGSAYRFTWAEPGSRLPGAGQAVVMRDFADAHDLAVGDRFPLVTPAGRSVRVTVSGVFANAGTNPVLGTVVMSRATFDATFPRPTDGLVLVDAPSREAVARAVAAYPDVQVDTRGEYASLVAADIDDVMGLIYVLLALSVVVALVGMASTLALSVHERTREIGTLRAMGLTRRQVRRMVRAEAAMTAFIGAVIGLPLGIGVGAAVAHALDGQGVGVVIPWTTITAFLVVAVVAGGLAAVMPARRAARLLPSAALQYE